MITKKEYTVLLETKQGTSREVSGTVEHLVKYFSYTLEVGNSHNKKINKNPTTINALINNYNKAVDEQYGGYFRPYISLKTA